MIQFITALGFFVFAYLLGSVPMAIVVSRAFGLPDPRHSGSKNPGATNMLRIGGKKVAVIVLLADFLKGIIPVLLCQHFVLPVFVAWVGLGAVLGHVFPVFFQFKGGKGVATGAGVLMGLSWQIGVIMMLCWIFIVLLFRYSSLGAVVALLVTPFLVAWLTPQYLEAVIVIIVLILWRHQDNMRRLIKGTESKIGNHGHERS